MRKLLVTLSSSALLFAGVAGTASAQPVNQDGLVNVNIGDVTILENVAVAANIAATVCGINVGPLALGVLGQAVAVDRSGRTRTICTVDGQNVTISQN